MRSIWLVVAGLAMIAGMVALASSQGADGEKKQADPFVGEYVKFGRWESRKENLGEAARISIRKEGDTYILSKPYEHWKFKLIGDGVISDGKGGIGSIYQGEVRFADGHRVRVLRAEFCYEQFILYDLEARPGVPGQRK